MKELPKLTLNRDYVLATTKGHTIAFKKGVPTFVPAPVIHEVVAIGGERIDAAQGEGFEEPPVKKDDPTGQERKDLIFACFEDMVVRNVRDEFTAQSAPHVKALKHYLGFTVDNKERDLLWD